MIKLEEKFTSGVGGFSQNPLTYTQVARVGLAAVYERSLDGKVKDYETIRIKITPAGTSIFNQPPSTDDEECYPSTGQWGKWAWSFGNKEAALSKLKTLGEIADAEEAEEENPSPKIELTIPAVEFTTGEFAEKNSVGYPEAALFIKAAVINGSVIFVREERRNAKGKPSKIYSKSKI